MTTNETISSSRTTHQFSARPVRDFTLRAVVNPKELLSIILAVGGPILFVFTVGAERMAAHSKAWTVVLVVWISTCGLNVLQSVTNAMRLRRYARSVDSDAAELGYKLYIAERIQEGGVDIHTNAGVDLSSIEIDHLLSTYKPSDIELQTVVELWEQQRQRIEAVEKLDNSAKE